MKVKVFRIRLTKEHMEIDQEKLNEFLDKVIVRKMVPELVSRQPSFWSILIFYESQESKMQKKLADKITITKDTKLSEEEEKIYNSLKQWRYDKALELMISIYMICHNIELKTIAVEKPRTLDELSKIRGFGDQKVEKFGEGILSVLDSIMASGGYEKP